LIQFELGKLKVQNILCKGALLTLYISVEIPAQLNLFRRIESMA